MNGSRSIARARRRAGFTLVECLASLLFLAITVPAIVGALGVASRASEVAERSAIAGELAENKLNEMLVDDAWQNATQTTGDYGDDWPHYHWQVTTQNWAGDTAIPMTELVVEVFYPVQGSEHSVRLSTLVNASATAATTTNGATTGAGTATGTTR